MKTPFNQHTSAIQPAIDQDSLDEFYEKFWLTPGWNTLAPNGDESARYDAIQRMIARIRRQLAPEGRELSILDLGCGRGWLSNLLTKEGRVTGIDPVRKVIEQAQKNFPQVTFKTGSVDTLLGDPTVSPFNLIVCSEVIEHVPVDQQLVFLKRAGQLLQPGGYLIVTTPRGELRQAWLRFTRSSQPVEDWVSEKALAKLAREAGYATVCRDRAQFVGGLNRQSALVLRIRGLGRCPRFLRRLADYLAYETSIYQVALFKDSRSSSPQAAAEDPNPSV